MGYPAGCMGAAVAKRCGALAENPWPAHTYITDEQMGARQLGRQAGANLPMGADY
jgi:hypothetical protein